VKGKKQYRLIFRRQPHADWVTDLERCDFCEVNEAAIQQYGYSAKSFFPWPPGTFVRAGITERYVKYINEVIKKQSARGIWTRGLMAAPEEKRGNGGRRNQVVEINSAPECCAHHGHDITERQTRGGSIGKKRSQLAGRRDRAPRELGID